MQAVPQSGEQPGGPKVGENLSKRLIQNNFGDFQELYRLAHRLARKRLLETVRAGDLMTRQVVLVERKTPLAAVAETMARNNVSGVGNHPLFRGNPPKPCPGISPARLPKTPLSRTPTAMITAGFFPETIRPNRAHDLTHPNLFLDSG